MSNSEPARVSVKILDKEYFVACQPNERSDLLESADYLNKQMKLIRDGGKVLGADRVAVMAALNIANDLLRLRARGTGSQSEIGTRLKSMRERAETALQRGQQLEL
jgi:cell division protein ZapA